MAEQTRSKLIEEHPIGKGLDGFRASFSTVCEGLGIASEPDMLAQLGQEDLRTLTLSFLSALQSFKASALLPSRTGRNALRNDLFKIISAALADDFDFDRVKPILRLALSNESNDALIWDHVYDLITESTPPPRPIASSLQQTPWLHNTSSFANSSEYRQDVDRVLKMELGPLYVGLRRFHDVYFGRVEGLEAASKAVLEKCKEGSDPLFREGWKGWPPNANQDDVLSWFADLCEELAVLAEGHMPKPTNRRRPLAQPNKPIQGSTGDRKLDVGFVDDPKAGKNTRCHWSHILVPGELKSNPLADTASKAWLDLGTYAREVLAAQDTRRFVLGFTICGSLMRIWEFDRLGGLASEQFDINKDGQQLVFTVLGFLWMSDEELGFDPTIKIEHGQRFIEIKRDGSIERLVIEKVMQRARCIAGRATTCWKAYSKECPQKPLVIKDSWQYTERYEEGELLREATAQNVVNVARHYHHETIQIHGADDDIRNHIRGGLDVTRATNYRSERSKPPQTMVSGVSRQGRSNKRAGQKRSSSQTGAPIPHGKRSCSVSPTKAMVSDSLPNRVHRRVILRDYGKPIYKASSPSGLLIALEGCIEGHQSLHKAGFLHRDISINNLLINEDTDNPSWSSFLIDLDLAIKEPREGASGARGKTGTRAFMAIGALLGEQHSFMHDLESFFWVLFWICIHYNGPNEGRVVPRFEKWNYVDTEELAVMKLGVVTKEAIFIKTITDHFTPYYKPLIALLNRLRNTVFPKGGPWEQDDEKLYTQMREILRNGYMV